MQNMPTTNSITSNHGNNRLWKTADLHLEVQNVEAAKAIEVNISIRIS